LLLNFSTRLGNSPRMTSKTQIRMILAAPLVALALASASAVPAQADCYADYKAKKENPLRLAYGVIQLSGQACASPGAARAVVARRISRGGWTLLAVLSIFGPEGLAQRKANAGANYLRY
jgi:uncharacterized membrane protein